MSTTIGCPIPGASQPKEPARLIDANNVMEAVFCAVELYNSEYLAIQDEIKKIPTIDPESMRPTAVTHQSGRPANGRRHDAPEHSGTQLAAVSGFSSPVGSSLRSARSGSHRGAGAPEKRNAAAGTPCGR